MTLEIFLTILLMVSILTGLTVEAVKLWMDELERSYAANTLAGGISVVLSIIVGAAYAVMTGVTLNAKFAVVLVALVFFSWLSAMVGYDKVVQAIKQVKSTYGTITDNADTNEETEEKEE